MNLRTPYQILVDMHKRDMMSEFDRAEQRRRDAEAYLRFMAKILAPMN
jgi:hypothetical protein